MIDIKSLKINLEQKILESKKVVLVPHNRPDFDAIGSALGLTLIAKKLKKPSLIVVDDPIQSLDPGLQVIISAAKKSATCENTSERTFDIMNSDRYLRKISSDDFYILTDVNKSYLVSLKKELNNPENIFIIDHHAEDANTISSNHKYIDPSVSSASEIVSKLLTLFKTKVPAEYANYLLAGIFLDTARFTKNISSETMGVVSKLIAKGGDMNRVTDYFSEDFMSDRKVQELIDRTKKITLTIAIAAALENEEYTPEELAKAADYLLKYNVDGAFTIGKLENGVISVSARSKEGIDVGQVMKELGGGGNPYSAATKISDSTIEEVDQKILKHVLPKSYFKNNQ